MQDPGLRGRGVLGAHSLGGRAEPDARGAQQLVQPVLFQHVDAQVDQAGRQEVVHQRDGLAVGQPDPLQRDHHGRLGELQGGGDRFAGVGDLVADDLRARRPPGRRQVVVQAGQLDIPVDPLVGDQGSRAALADHHALVGQVLEGGPHGGAGQAEPLRELYLVVQPGTDLERPGPDRRLEVLGKLEVQGHRAGPVDGDHAEGGHIARGCLWFLHPARHPAPVGAAGPVPWPGAVAQVSRVVCSNIILTA